MIEVGDNFVWRGAEVSDEVVECRENVVFEGFDGVYVLVSGCPVDNKQAIPDAADTRFAAISNIDVKDVAESGRKGDRSSGYRGFIYCSSLANVHKWFPVYAG